MLILLFHGSPIKGLKYISPKRDKRVYATSNIGIAVVFGLIWDQLHADFKQVADKFIFTIKEEFPIFPVWIYVIKPIEGSFILAPNQWESYSYKQCDIISVQEIKDPIEFLKSSNVQVVNL